MGVQGICNAASRRPVQRRRSYWHLSKILATQTGMTKEWLASQGLISVRDLWIKAQGNS